MFLWSIIKLIKLCPFKRTDYLYIAVQLNYNVYNFSKCTHIINCDFMKQIQIYPNSITIIIYTLF